MTHGRYIPGTDPLAPVSYTDEQREDLVRRVRAADERSNMRRPANFRNAPRCYGNRPRPELPAAAKTTLSRITARYAALMGLPLSRAAWDVSDFCKQRVAHTPARDAWREIYPGRVMPGRAPRST